MKLVIDEHSEVFYPVVVFKHQTVVKEDDCAVVVRRLKEAESNKRRAVEPTKTEPVLTETVANEPSTVEQTTLTEVVKKIGNVKRKSHSLSVWGSRLSALAVSIIVLIAVALVGMRLSGFRTFTVMSGSMEPEFPVGSLIYVKPVDYSSLNVGDVISYVANDEKTVVTHRIVEIEIDEEDSTVWRFRTKGDTNTSADAGLVHYKNVLGTPSIVVPFIGYVAHNIQQPPGIYIALVVGTLLLAWTFLPGTLEERRRVAKKSILN